MKTSRKIIAVDVYLERRSLRELVGRLDRINKFVFEYCDRYFYGKSPLPLGPDLPLSKKKHKSHELFPSFYDRIPSQNNPAYGEYCQMVGISEGEKDLLVLVSTLGRKGPSSFILSPVYEDSFSSKDFVEFRKELKLSSREFSELFDLALSTTHRIEKEKSQGSDTLKRIEIYARFPEVALFQLAKNGAKVNDRVKVRLEKHFKKIKAK